MAVINCKIVEDFVLNGVIFIRFFRENKTLINYLYFIKTNIESLYQVK